MIFIIRRLLVSNPSPRQRKVVRDFFHRFPLERPEPNQAFGKNFKYFFRGAFCPILRYSPRAQARREPASPSQSRARDRLAACAGRIAAQVPRSQKAASRSKITHRRCFAKKKVKFFLQCRILSTQSSKQNQTSYEIYFSYSSTVGSGNSPS